MQEFQKKYKSILVKKRRGRSSICFRKWL